MNDPKEQQEPSMEEILASIRRIISEDEEGGEGGEGGDEAGAESAPEEASEIASEDDIDALMADDSPAEDEKASDDDIDSIMAAAKSAPEADNDDVLNLTEEVQDDGTVVDLDADGGDEAVEIVAVDIDEPKPEPKAESPPEVPQGGGLVAPPIAAEATSTFAGLASAVELGRLASSQGIGGRTVEDVVKEVVRPIVKEWLDANLAALVERLVSREIDRMSRRAEDQIPE